MLSQKFSLAIHGGSGTILKSLMTSQLEEQHEKKLMEALEAGEKVLSARGTALDAVQAAIRILEDSQIFNAGRGAVLSAKGNSELDASIMEGKTRKAGAVASTTNIKNPISAARKVMEKSNHVMLSGQGAKEFAELQGLEIVDTGYYYNQLRVQQLKLAQEKQLCILDHDGSKHASQFAAEFNPAPQVKTDEKFGTVGAVALDVHGNLAAGTSTGGMTNKKYGRIGDSPLIGAGCYANNKTCAVSSTGQGEFFMRGVVAYDISAIMEFAKLNLEEAANKVIHERLAQLNGHGGVIAVDALGNVAMPFNTQGMYRGYVKSNGEKKVQIYKC